MKVVLLIDDEPQMKGLVAMTLDDLGVRVVRAATFSDARDVARRESPDLVLLDVDLGNEDGLSILPHLREEPSLTGVPVVIVTVHDSKREEALGMGVEGFVAKPFKVSLLRDVVEPFLR